MDVKIDKNSHGWEFLNPRLPRSLRSLATTGFEMIGRFAASECRNNNFSASGQKPSERWATYQTTVVASLDAFSRRGDLGLDFGIEKNSRGLEYLTPRLPRSLRSLATTGFRLPRSLRSLATTELRLPRSLRSLATTELRLPRSLRSPRKAFISFVQHDHAFAVLRADALPKGANGIIIIRETKTQVGELVMDIVWYGHSCFRVMERGMASIVMDPYDNDVIGLEPLKLKADIVTVSHDMPGHNFVSAVKSTSHTIEGPGEYEIGGVFITGVRTDRGGAKNAKNLLFHFDFDGVKIAHFGDLTQLPTQSEIEVLGDVNIALVPVGGGNSLNAAKAAELISMIEPNIVIPMHYEIPGLKVKLDPLTKFLKEMGVTEHQTESTLKVTKSSLSEDTKVIVMEPTLKGNGKEE